ncbi:MAG: hypothetical protein ACOVN9_11540, partial [Inhella sp.]
VDNAKSYRGVALSLRAHLPAEAACLSSISLSESMRGVLHYHLGHSPLRSRAVLHQAHDLLSP